MLPVDFQAKVKPQGYFSAFLQRKLLREYIFNSSKIISRGMIHSNIDHLCSQYYIKTQSSSLCYILAIYILNSNIVC